MLTKRERIEVMNLETMYSLKSRHGKDYNDLERKGNLILDIWDLLKY